MFGILAMERPELNTLGSLTALVVSLTLGVWLTGRFGLSGTAVGVLLSRLALAGVRWTASR